MWDMVLNRTVPNLWIRLSLVFVAWIPLSMFFILLSISLNPFTREMSLFQVFGEALSIDFPWTLPVFYLPLALCLPCMALFSNTFFVILYYFLFYGFFVFLHYRFIKHGTLFAYALLALIFSLSSFQWFSFIQAMGV